MSQSVLAFLVTLCWGVRKLCISFCVQLYSRVPPSPAAPPVLSLPSQLAQRPGRWVPCSSRVWRPHGAGELGRALVALLLVLGAVPSSTLRREPAFFPGVPTSAPGGMQAAVALSDFPVCLPIACSEIKGTLVCLSGKAGPFSTGQKLWGAVCCAGGGGNDGLLP